MLTKFIFTLTVLIASSFNALDALEHKRLRLDSSLTGTSSNVGGGSGAAGVAVTASGSVVNWMTLINMPRSKVLRERLETAGFAHFETTALLSKRLGSHRSAVNALTVGEAVAKIEYALYDYYLNERITLPIIIAMEGRRAALFQLALQDTPGAYEAYERWRQAIIPGCK